MKRASTLVLAFALASCGTDEMAAQTPTPSPVATPTPTPVATFAPSIPLLEEGPHMGMITGFDALTAEKQTQASALYAQAKGQGMSIGRVQVDWSELETERGVYDADALADIFNVPDIDGLNLFVTLSSMDSEGLTFPDYLMDGEDLRDDLDLDSAEVTDAFGNFLRWLAEQLENRPVWGVALGNEGDGLIAQNLYTDAEAAGFMARGLAAWNAASSDIAVTVTYTTYGHDNAPMLYQASRDGSDLVSLNHYCLNAELLVTQQAQWEADLAAIQAAAGDRQIFFQELGCPFSDVIGGTLANQNAYFTFMLDRITNDPQLRAATVFQLFDWSEGLSASLGQAIRDEGLDEAADRFEAWLNTIGMCRFPNSDCGQAYDSFLAGLATMQAARAGS